MANRAKDQLVFAGPAAIEDEGTVHMPIGTHNEADAHLNRRPAAEAWGRE